MSEEAICSAFIHNAAQDVIQESPNNDTIYYQNQVIQYYTRDNFILFLIFC